MRFNYKILFNSPDSANRIGSLIMVFSMAAFAIEDSLIKITSEELPLGQILLFIGLGGTLLFTLLALINKDKLLTPELLSWPMQARILMELIGRIFYSLALALTPLSSTTIILQATPIVVVVGAVVFFGEKVTLIRWFAVFVGMLGVTIIVGPGDETFSVLSILAVIGMLGFALRDLASRASPKSLGIFVLGVHGFLSLTLAGGLLSFFSSSPFIRPDGEMVYFLVVTTLAGMAGYASLMKAMRIGDVSAITPFRYSRLLFGVSIGLFFFGEELTFSVIVGSIFIVFSSFFLFFVERRV